MEKRGRLRRRNHGLSLRRNNGPGQNESNPVPPPWRDPPRGFPEASAPKREQACLGVTRASHTLERDRSRPPKYNGRYSSQARAVLQHDSQVLVESPDGLRSGGRI